MTITDDMLDRHAARGIIVADQFRRGASIATEDKAVASIISESAAMAKVDGITDKGIAGFLAMAAICHFHLRIAGGDA